MDFSNEKWRGGFLGRASIISRAATDSQRQRLSTQENNQKAVQYLAAAVAALIVLFTALHWVRYICRRHGPKNDNVSKITDMMIRSTQRIAQYGRPSLISAYLLINVVLTVTNIDWSDFIGIAKRCGWMALGNMAIITFLAIKNTPLAPLTSYSYERLNCLHRIGGYVTGTYALIHLVLMCVKFSKAHELEIIIERAQIYGLVAASAMFIMLTTAIFIRKIQYEIFYTTHVVMYILVVITVGLHRPNYAQKAVIITTSAGSIWALDRIIRGYRLLIHFHNKATITPLPHGGTRLVLGRRSLSRVVPGSHCYLWIPKVRLMETHPFTIAAITPQSLEFVVAAQNGFTKALHQYALLHPGAELRASLDGPYGAHPIFSGDVADNIVLIAGGSGASFTFGVALDIIQKQLKECSKSSIDFIWTVKEHEALSWFSKELAELQSAPQVTLHLYTTKATCSDLSQLLMLPTSTSYRQSDFPIDVEKAPTSTGEASLTKIATFCSLTSTVTFGRPGVDNLIKDIVTRADDKQRVVIAACGPQGLMKAVRKTVSSITRLKGPTVELHCETFGW